jgi:hypothetical protein
VLAVQPVWVGARACAGAGRARARVSVAVSKERRPRRQHSPAATQPRSPAHTAATHTAHHSTHTHTHTHGTARTHTRQRARAPRRTALGAGHEELAAVGVGAAVGRRQQPGARVRRGEWLVRKARAVDRQRPRACAGCACVVLSGGCARARVHAWALHAKCA